MWRTVDAKSKNFHEAVTIFFFFGSDCALGDDFDCLFDDVACEEEV